MHVIIKILYDELRNGNELRIELEVAQNFLIELKNLLFLESSFYIFYFLSSNNIKNNYHAAFNSLTNEINDTNALNKL